MDVSLIVNNVKFNYRVGLLVKKGEYILVECNPDYDFVLLPGGRVKTLESSTESIIREVLEDLDIDISKDSFKAKAFIESFFDLDNVRYHELYMVYKITIDENDNRFKDNMINHDSDKNYYKWIKTSDLEKANLLPKLLTELKDDESFEHFISNEL